MKNHPMTVRRSTEWLLVTSKCWAQKDYGATPSAIMEELPNQRCPRRYTDQAFRLPLLGDSPLEVISQPIKRLLGV
jgi:hypothetical protein